MTKKQQIQIFEEKKVRTVWDDETQQWYFSIADVVQVLTDSTDVKQYIKKMRSRDPELNARWGTICTPTRMLATDGKYYKTQAATMEGIFRIIQSIPSEKAEPFKQWMAEVAAHRIDQMQDPELNFDQAGDARKKLERQVGHSVISPSKAADYLPPVEDVKTLPNEVPINSKR